jgi:hypothetical protein
MPYIPYGQHCKADPKKSLRVVGFEYHMVHALIGRIYGKILFMLNKNLKQETSYELEALYDFVEILLKGIPGIS